MDFRRLRERWRVVVWWVGRWVGVGGRKREVWMGCGFVGGGGRKKFIRRKETK
jgi:hypothetical protein